ncbi:MAG: hypothetical protein A3D99_04785 [Candidatus Andersenbacteria bacterium RIFCSPHIGHO2_12_FULL_45_11]|uniref:Carrier domain-containing protein n=1 Tax=Candidatus Andersenbacteria bacterium RIFCSPHIGHO2_12_FULL_45_11 TaxID=1797281 RepID=A0A1G1X1J9_9BACT|nr:MAG: hypothetical protein A3D99_04785 [Candidatus Andersenbacteria bacterium RIFCSPHIGHO2_12_FULL_45_11]
MDRQEVLKAVSSAVKESLSDEDLKLSESSQLTNDLGVDSGDYLDIICRLEQQFGIPQPQEKGVKRMLIATFRTVGDICEYVEQQLAGQQLTHA